jgi:acyl-CoA dehydrogenase
VKLQPGPEGIKGGPDDWSPRVDEVCILCGIPVKRSRPAWSDGETEEFRDLARAFFTKECAPHEERWSEQRHVDRDVWIHAGRVGLLCPSIPVEYGGGGGTFAHEAVIAEEQIRAHATSMGLGVHSTVVAHYLYLYGTEDQRRRYLPRMASGEFLAAIAMTEPGTGSDLRSIRTTAVREGDEFVLEGSKTFLTNGMLANLILVVAKTKAKDGAAGISLLIVETDGLDGFSRGQPLKKVGQHGQDTAEVFFSAVRVPATNVLGGVEGEGFAQLMQQLPQERLILGVLATAAIEEAVSLTLDYTRKRRAFNKPIFDFQNTRFSLAEAATISKVARVFIDDCISKHLVGQLDVETAAMAKWWLTDQQCAVVDACLQFFGGYGYMAEYPIARMFMDARVQKIYGGTNEIMKELISRHL